MRKASAICIYTEQWINGKYNCQIHKLTIHNAKSVLINLIGDIDDTISFDSFCNMQKYILKYVSNNGYYIPFYADFNAKNYDIVYINITNITDIDIGRHFVKM